MDVLMWVFMYGGVLECKRWYQKKNTKKCQSLLQYIFKKNSKIFTKLRGWALEFLENLLIQTYLHSTVLYVLKDF